MFLTTTLTPEQRLTRVTVDIMSHPRYTAMAGVLMIGTKRIEPDAAQCPTAYTNGRDEVYGADFIADLSVPEFRFLVLHECKHKVYRHITTWKHLWDEDKDLANMACDYVINLEIVDENPDGFATMTGKLESGCYDTKYRGWDAGQVFEDLKQQQEQGGGQGRGGGQPLDEHGWEDAQAMSEEEQAALGREIDAAIRQGVLAAGKLGIDVDRSITDLLKPKIDWRQALREFITETCAGSDDSTWSRPNRRFLSAGIYMPSGISERVTSIAVAGDMSGSIGQREQSVILGAIAGLAEQVQPERVDMLYWDTQVRAHEKYDLSQLSNFAKSTKPRGGGGTDVVCVPAYLQQQGLKPQCAIVITDGYVFNGWGAWSCPVLWVVIGNPRCQPTVGKVLHIDTKDL